MSRDSTVVGHTAPMSRTTYNDGDDDVLHQGRHTTAVCHVNEAHKDDDCVEDLLIKPSEDTRVATVVDQSVDQR